MAANTVADIIAMDSPVIPNHMPPTANNFISPIPIGGNWLFCFFIYFDFSNIRPMIKPMLYASAPDMAAIPGEIIQSKQFANIIPISKSGNK